MTQDSEAVLRDNWQAMARDMLRRLETMRPPNVVLQQVTMLGEARDILKAALASPTAGGGTVDDLAERLTQLLRDEMPSESIIYRCVEFALAEHPQPAEQAASSGEATVAESAANIRAAVASGQQPKASDMTKVFGDPRISVSIPPSAAPAASGGEVAGGDAT